MSMYYAVLVATPEPPPRHRRHSLAMLLVALLGVPLGALSLGPSAPAPGAAEPQPGPPRK